MANPKHLAKLNEGVEAWNKWRDQNLFRPDHSVVRPDFHKADLQETTLDGAHLIFSNFNKATLVRASLSKANLVGTNFNRANLAGADLGEADLREANFSHANLADVSFCGANLEKANLQGADLGRALLIGANLSDANLSGAIVSSSNLRRANLTRANLSRAKLVGADLTQATLLNTNLERASLTACSVHGISVWNVRLKGAIQSDLIITPRGEPPIRVDHLEVAQFIYLLLNNERVRSVIDTITSKVVLILGRFTPDRKVVLDAIRDELRTKNYVPVLFDFEKPASKDLTGTITTLANMARFIIADLTDPNSVPHELATVVPNTVVPVQAIVLAGRRAYPMFDDLRRRHHWVLKPYQYKSKDLLIAQLGERVIAPAEAKAKKLAGQRLSVGVISGG